MTSDKYLDEVYTRLRALFIANKNGYSTGPAERHRLEGFMQAGVFMGLTSNAELTQLMEAVHQEVFGRPMAERKARKPVGWRDEAFDYSQFETPAFERHTRRKPVMLQNTRR